MSDPAAAPLDPRRHAYRADLAAEELMGRVEARRYVKGEPRRIARPAVPLRRLPRADAGLETEALFGEMVRVLDIADGWAWVQLARDRYVGYLPADTLSARVEPATHRVKALGTFVYPVADIKAPPVMHLSLNAELVVAEADDNFVRLGEGGFVIARQVAPVGRYERDFVDVAERFIATPYLWGGRTRIGIDCSGLVQMALMAAGVDCPRDSDMQREELGARFEATPLLDDLRRGDLVFWRGHVGIMVDGVLMVHANAHHMAVVTETLPEANERILRAGGELLAVRRLGTA
jgi:cell wall-associated NlpC family hydrolase